MASNTEELLECSICCLPFSDPKKLPCDHTFCVACVKRMTNVGRVKCPTCSKVHSIDDVRPDFHLHKFLDVLAEQAKTLTLQQQGASTMTSPEIRGKVCELCESKSAEHWCQDCEQAMCEICKKSHSRAKSSRNHIFRSVSDLKRDTNARLRIPRTDTYR